MFKQTCILISSLLLLGCYASSTNAGAVKEHKQEATQKVEEVVRCCFVIRDLDTGLKDYDCEDMSFLECRTLKARSDGD